MVKLDITKTEKYLTDARLALENTDWEKWVAVEKTYSLATNCDPTGIVALFYDLYRQARFCLVEKDFTKRQHVFSLLCVGISSVADSYHLAASEANQRILRNIHTDLTDMLTGSFLYSSEAALGGTLLLFVKTAQAFVDCMEAIYATDEQPVYREILQQQCLYIASSPAASASISKRYREKAQLYENKT